MRVGEAIEKEFSSNGNYGDLGAFPFQPLGFVALIILFLMAATSHDFWLANLGPSTWKTLHTLVYFAYGLLIGATILGYIFFGDFPDSWTWVGAAIIVASGVYVAYRERVRAQQEDV